MSTDRSIRYTAPGARTIPTDTPAPRPDWVVHPGEILREALDERGMTQAQLAEALGHADASQVSRLCNGRADINAATAVRLERVLGISAEVWLRLQMAYDLHHARREALRDGC